MRAFLSILKKKHITLFTLLILFVSLLCSKIFLNNMHPDYDILFQKFTEEVFRREVSSDTISLHYTLKSPEKYALEDCPISYGRISSDSSAALSSVETTLTALETFASLPLSEKNQLTYNILHYYLELGAEGCNYLLFQEPLGSVSGIHTQLPILLSEFPFHTKNDVATYLKLLAQTDSYFREIIHFEQEKIESGLFMADVQIDAILEYCNTFLSMGNANPLIQTFPERLQALPLTSEEQQDFIHQNICTLEKHVFPAYEYLISSLQKLKGNGTNDMGLCYFPNGKEYFSYLLKQEAGLSQSVPELQAMTKNQIAEDLASMEQVLTSGSTSSSENSILFQEPSFILENLKKETTSHFPGIPDVGIDIKYVSSAMEEYLSPAFYMIPPIDNSTENVIYINPGQTLEGLDLYTTLAHEGYPGHLYQTVYFTSRNPDPLRSLLHFGGYIEGWATYAEMMSYYLTPLSKEEATLFQKNTSVILGLYALADMGIHYDGWTLQNTIDFFSGYGINAKETIQEIYHLIIGSPANYCKYYLGYLSIYNLKKEIAKTLGDDFSQLDFHEAVLDVGPAPFQIVEEFVRSKLQ